jgi:hypothetical protein
MTRLRAGRSGVRVWLREKDFALLQNVQTGLQLLLGCHSPEQNGLGVRVTAHLQQVPKFRMSGSVLLLSLYAFLH